MRLIEGQPCEGFGTFARLHVLYQLACRIASIKLSHPVRVAIDGVDAAGKTMLADELVAPIEKLGRIVIRGSIDGFHRPRIERYEQGADSPEGYYYDSFDHAALRAALLDPLGPGGSQHYRRAVFDLSSDSPVEESLRESPVDAVLLFDGVFLLRPELADCWDYAIFVAVDFEIAVARAVVRDIARGADKNIAARYRTRYVPGQRIYLQSVRPQEHANVVLENNDPSNPKLVLCEP